VATVERVAQQVSVFKASKCFCHYQRKPANAALERLARVT